MKRLFILLLALFLAFTFVSCDNFWSSSSSSSNNNGGGGSASTPDYLCFAATGASTIAMALTGTVTPLPALEYSKDGSTWTAFEIGTTTVDLADGEKVYFRGDNTAFASVADNYVKFVMTGSIAASGNIMSLLDKKCASKTIPADNCFKLLFWSCNSLTTAPVLPATTLAEACYSGMFNGCISLTTAPELPATTLVEQCYAVMFNGCSGLTSIRVHFTDWNDAENSTTSWVNGVSATGTFYYKSGLSPLTQDGTNHVPTNFTPSATL